MNKIDYISEINSLSADDLIDELINLFNCAGGLVEKSIYALVLDYINKNKSINFEEIFTKCDYFLEENILSTLISKCKAEHKYTLCDKTMCDDACDIYDDCDDCPLDCSCCEPFIIEYVYSCLLECNISFIICTVLSNIMYESDTSFDMFIKDSNRENAACSCFHDFCDTYDEGTWEAVKPFMLSDSDHTAVANHAQLIMFDFEDDNKHYVYTYGKDLIITTDPKFRTNSYKKSIVSKHINNLVTCNERS